MRVGLAAAVLFVAGCGGSAQCVRTSACGAAQVCRSDGTCGPLAVDAVAHSAHATRLEVSGLAVDGDAARADLGDALVLGGGDDAVRLAFDGIGGESEPVSAELVLFPSPTRADLGGDARIVVDVVESLDAGDVLVRSAAVRSVAGGPERSVRVDVTDVVRAARAGGRTRLVLSLRADGGPLVVGSPRAADASVRPRLEVLAP